MLGWATVAAAQAPNEQERYLRAVAIAAEGKLGAASEELEFLARGRSSMADRCAYEAGLLFERRGALRKAADLFGAVAETSYFFSDARLAMARVWRLHGNLDAAAASIAKLSASPARSVRTKALVELSTIATLKGDERGLRDAQVKLTMNRAPWLGGAPVLAMISRSHDSLIQRNECLDARRVAWRTSAALACPDRLFTAEAAACLGKDVSTDLRRIIRDCPQAELAARAWMTLGVVQARSGSEAAAAASFRHVAKVAPASPLAGEALFAAFWVGWKENPAHATGKDLVRLEALPLELSAQQRARVRYWRSRVAQARGAPKKATGLLAEVARLYPATWYGHLARERLGKADFAGASTVALAAVIPTQSDDSAELEALEQLKPGIVALKLGLANGADELTALARRWPSAASNRVTIEVLNAAGASDVAYRFARAVLREQTGHRHDAAVWQEAFPTHFSELIAAHVEQTNVAPDFVQGLMREESSFNPVAKSHCGAMGLMQLMPATARALANERGVPLESLSELFQPQLNVQLGAGYLGQLLKRFGGNRAAAAAAYNGGPTRVAGWLKGIKANQREEWVEEIPLDETRNYVKDVLASADIYEHRLTDRSLMASADARTVALP
jgi:soluble lytic murein transglycosylase